MAMNKAIACMMNGFLIVPDRLSRAADPILHTELPVAIFCHGEVPLYDIYQFCKRSASYSCQRDPGSPRMENRSDRSNAMNDQEPISVARARAQVRQLVAPLGTEDIPLLNANGRVLSATIRSGMELPPFTRAAMDGYALGAGPDRAGTRFEVVGHVAAGDPMPPPLAAGQAVRILTGAPVPAETMAIVQQEWATRLADHVVLERDVNEGMHIRLKGETLPKGASAIEARTILSPAALGFLSMLGITEVPVHRRPRVSVLVTGSELIAPGSPLRDGQVYESNSAMLASALARDGAETKMALVDDDPDRIQTAIANALSNCDMLLISGGNSVGDHDHVHAALHALKVTEVFHHVAQKPGKPLYFGSYGRKPVFALPGNPAASLVCYRMYVLDALRRMQGVAGRTDESLALPLANCSVKGVEHAQFLFGRVRNGRVSILGEQGSSMLQAAAHANVLVHIPARDSGRGPGDIVRTYRLWTMLQ